MKKPILLLCLFGISLNLLFAQPEGKPIQIGQSFSMDSEIMSEERPYLVYLPEIYEEDGEPVAVLYLMDGDGHFHHTTGMVDFLMRQGRIPPMMVVGIPNTPNNRTRDLTPPIEKDQKAKEQFKDAGQADRTLSFLREELIPHIDKAYNTNSYRTLVGHSFGGIFVVQALLTQSDVYDSFLSISPSMWWDDQNLVTKAKAFLDKKPDLDGFFYMTMGNEGGDMLGGAQKLAELLAKKAPKSFGSEFKLMEEETHGSVPHRSTYYGLEAIFAPWFRADLEALFADGGIAAIDAHFEKMQHKLGFKTEISENDLNQLGYALMAKENMSGALEVFETNIKRFPKSFNVYDSMGEALKKKGDTKESIKFYQKSLDLNPGNEGAIKMLAEMDVIVDPLANAPKLSEKQLAEYTGTYEIDLGGEVKIELKEGVLHLTAQNGPPPQTLVVAKKDQLISRPLNFTLQFERDEQGKVSHFDVQLGPGQKGKATLKSK